jgi:hypothetical protein
LRSSILNTAKADLCVGIDVSKLVRPGATLRRGRRQDIFPHPVAVRPMRGRAGLSVTQRRYFGAGARQHTLDLYLLLHSHIHRRERFRHFRVTLLFVREYLSQ